MDEPARIKVTVTDLDTGDTEERVISDDYVITCAGSAYVDHVQAYANGTHVVTIKDRKQASAIEQSVVDGMREAKPE